MNKTICGRASENIVTTLAFPQPIQSQFELCGLMESLSLSTRVFEQKPGVAQSEHVSGMDVRAAACRGVRRACNAV